MAILVCTVVVSLCLASASGAGERTLACTELPQDEKDGKASKFVGTDPGLGNVAYFEGTVLGMINGKASEGEFKE